MLMIATPMRGAQPMAAPVCFGYSESVRALTAMYPSGTLPAVGFPSDIVRARNRIAAMILRDWPRVDHVLWWDDDEWPEDVKAIPRMIATGEDLIGLPYTNKRLPVRWLHAPLPGDGEPVNDLLEVRGVGFGLTVTSRHCLAKMSAAARKYTDHPRLEKVADIFGQLYDHPTIGGDPESDDAMLLGEDFSFCKRWRELGGRVMVYAGKGNIVNHAGSHAWSARDMGAVE